MRIILSAFIVILLTGCPPTNKATFINTSDIRIRVVILNTKDKGNPQDNLAIDGRSKKKVRVSDLMSSPSIIKGYNENSVELFSVSVDPVTVGKLLTPNGEVTLEFNDKALVIK